MVLIYVRYNLNRVLAVYGAGLIAVVATTTAVHDVVGEVGRVSYLVSCNSR